MGITHSSANLNETLPKSSEECLASFVNYSYTEKFCQPEYDYLLCWPPMPPGSGEITQPCPLFVHTNVVGLAGDPGLIARRICQEDGLWYGNKTNYSICVDSYDTLYRHELHVYVVAIVIVVFSVLSLIALIISLFIFFYFRSLHCSRLKVHRNMCVAVILYLIFLMPPPVSILMNYTWSKLEWLCKGAVTLHLFSQMAAVGWMFVEGFHLHSRVTVHIFRQDAPFKLYYFIGWGLPGILIAIWAFIMSKTTRAGKCWSGLGEENCRWLISAPMLVALTANTLFMVNIIRVLLTKHQANNATEALQVKKAMKATALLFPLLGVTHLIFAIKPTDGTTGEATSWIIMAFTRSSHGLIFGILYCFMNSDVQTALRNAYLRSRSRRNPNKRNRLRASRGMSQTSNTYVSHSDGNILESSRHKRESRVSLPMAEINKSSQKCTLITSNGSETLTML